MRVRSLLTLIFCISIVSTSVAQGTLRGFVYEEDSGEPMIFTNVFLKGTTLGSSTGENGYFSIGDIPFGNYTLMVTSLGYDTLAMDVSVASEDIITKKLFLEKSGIQMEAFEISAAKQEALTNVTISITKATPKEIKQLPSIGATPDLAQYLQVVPGVIFTGDQGGQLYIRGGSPVQNLVLQDGMTVYNPFHSIGLFSVFDTEIIRTADIYTGGFGAEYGGRISSVIDITMRDGNKRRYAGKVGASTFAANVLLEGPIKKQTNEGKSSSSFILSAKHSYLDQSSKALYSYIDEDGLPFSFTDLYGKVSFNASSGSNFSLFGFNYRDNTIFQETSRLNWIASGGGLNFVLVPSGSTALIEGRFNLSDYKITLEEQTTTVGLDGDETVRNLPPRKSGINSFNFGINFKYFKGDNEFKYGVDINGYGTSLSFFTPLNQKIDRENNSTELAGYVAYKFKLNHLILDLGLRAQYYSSIRVFKPEPRFGIKYNITKDLRIKGAAGLYSQNIISVTSDRDIVNLFYGFMVAPQNLQDKFTTKDGDVRDVKNPLQKAYHLIAGVEYDLTDRITLNVEGYYKKFTQLTNINRNKTYSKDNLAAPDILKNDFIIESGDAEGIDMTLKYETRRIYFWAVYSLARVNRWDGIRVYSPIFDRHNNVNLLASYSFGKSLDWEFSARWNYGSGLPFTQNQGFYLGEVMPNDILTDITNTNTDEPAIQYAGLNQGRLPSYHRLDVTLKRTFDFSDYSNLVVTASITNVYDRQNIFYINRVSGDRVDQLPFLPSVGILYSF